MLSQIIGVATRNANSCRRVLANRNPNPRSLLREIWALSFVSEIRNDNDYGYKSLGKNCNACNESPPENSCCFDRILLFRSLILSVFSGLAFRRETANHQESVPGSVDKA